MITSAPTSLVITTINSSKNSILVNYSSQCNSYGIELIIVGDVSTPDGFQLDNTDFLDYNSQKSLPFKLAAALPDNNYAKKNLGYLKAILKGSSRIIETDDDNIPYDSFWMNSEENVCGHYAEETSWTNTYRHFSQNHIWPRGFPLNKVMQENSFRGSRSNDIYICPVQQNLVNENPDVDAIYRLTKELPFFFEDNVPFILGTNSMCPFNSQNTVWFRQAFPLLYLPSYCSFRMTDIWRSFIAQRIFWTCNWHISFHSPTAFQKRNPHNLLNDFELEIPGYLNNEEIMRKLILLELQSGEENILNNLKICYQMMVKEGYIDKKELLLVDAWIHDINTIL